VKGSEAARSCLPQAASLAQRFQATLQVLHCLESGDARSVAQARQELCSWIPGSLNAQCVVQPLARRGRAAEQIVRFAADEKTDLIVLGAPAQRRLGSVLFGDTTELVLRNAPVPVLVLPQR
jgi:nucleotide-binding universal stress UspA family protein